MTPWLPLPAGTLVGVTGRCTVIVNCAATASTVRFSGGADVVCPVEAALPVMTTLYDTVLVSLLVVIVAEALAGGATVAGLTAQTGASVAVCPDVVATEQLSVTSPANPLTVPTVIFADEVPPGAIATSDREGADRVKLP